MYGDKIRLIREIRGFSQQYMADKLTIGQNSYSKIELNQCKLSAEMLQKISVELGISPVDLLSPHPLIINFESTNISRNDLVEKIVSAKDAEIAYLKEIITDLLKDKDRLLVLLERK